MNFLAHLYLSGSDPKIKLGNFIGDFVKGKNLAARFEPDIVKGITLHREIDLFTDLHPVVKQSKDRLRPVYRHYSGVIVDVFYDHFLAYYWQKFSLEPLPDFATQCYRLIQEHESILPDEVNRMLPYMIKGNWLVNYAQIEGIRRALTGMANRTPYPSKMEAASQDLKTHFMDFESEFNLFFPELQKFCMRWINSQA
jgi:acyl carrier protein phosphodiesterase